MRQAHGYSKAVLRASRRVADETIVAAAFAR
jgi:hypothetical protein